ncbi:hypothetical protein QEH56_22230 [Pelagicoccus enzymogenes]|uniref:hypothetical protein n=1 Tax=Pelagicoccus enzymogenes TaxID=2773457 RepID=UPI00280FC140|nr:hypothetical protein [Pelagicoccus enzymogenes]MDQ8200901.1 hypothetical protein [Pelagicoccus enzymogenes]
MHSTAYENWTNDQLARAATHERKQYEKAAIDLIRSELEKRKINSQMLADFEHSTSNRPPHRTKGTWLMPRLLNRKQFFLRWSSWLVVFTAGLIGIVLALPDSRELREELSLFFLLIAVLYKIGCIHVPRARNAGLHPLMLLLFLVPLVNIGLYLFLFFAPPKRSR